MVARLTEVYGKDVYTVGGMRVGSLEDISIEPESGRLGGLIISDIDRVFWSKISVEGRKGVVIPYSGVKAVGDIVLIGNVRYEAQAAEEE
ncbi:MAG: PRC-barrel domain-containing protein [Candidatus Hydrothermarchaeales archaeon]